MLAQHINRVSYEEPKAYKLLVLCDVVVLKRLLVHNPKCRLYIAFGLMISAKMFLKFRNKSYVDNHILGIRILDILEPVLNYSKI